MSSFPHPSDSGNTVGRRSVIGALALAPLGALLTGCGLRVDDLTPPTPEPASPAEDVRNAIAVILDRANTFAAAGDDEDLKTHTAALLAASGGLYVNAAETMSPPPEPTPVSVEDDIPQEVQYGLADAFGAVSESWGTLADESRGTFADIAAGCSVLSRWLARRADRSAGELEDLSPDDTGPSLLASGDEAIQAAYGEALEYAYAAQYAAERAAVRLEGGPRDTATRRVDDFDDVISSLREYLRGSEYDVPEPRAAYDLALDPSDAGRATALLVGIEDAWSERIEAMLAAPGGPRPVGAWLVDSARARQDLTDEIQVLRFAVANEAEQP